MSIPATTWGCPPPEDGERPVSVAEAALITGYSRDRIQKRIRRGILPAVMPMGYQRGRMVFVSQLRYVMERPVVVGV
ncbi:MAG TPA: helix-turn-helix domain-containing protein [Candidatus Olsenella pullicola]|nr:helix-turn-helix domain-containing protein [Candidatus Olsenella pullicola]